MIVIQRRLIDVVETFDSLDLALEWAKQLGGTHYKHGQYVCAVYCLVGNIYHQNNIARVIYIWPSCAKGKYHLEKSWQASKPMPHDVKELEDQNV